MYWRLSHSLQRICREIYWRNTVESEIGDYVTTGEGSKLVETRPCWNTQETGDPTSLIHSFPGVRFSPVNLKIDSKPSSSYFHV